MFIFHYMFSTIAFKLVLSLLLGAAIGLERGNGNGGDERGSAGGIRTFALVSLLGAFAGFFYTQHAQSMFLLLSIFVAAMVVAYYCIGSYLSKRLGLTNEISIIFTFLLGFLVTTEFLALQIVIALLVVLMLILSLKTQTKKLVLGISSHETRSFISYAIIALVVLPFLPNISLHLQDIPVLNALLESYHVDLGRFAELEILNPRKLWFIVALVTGIDVFGYVLGKILGSKRSFTLTSFVGGFISSTSTTQSLAQKSKKSHMLSALVGAALIANMASFFQVFLLVGPLNNAWLIAITPTLLLIIISAFVIASYFLSRKEQERETRSAKEKTTSGHKIFSLLPALKFALLIIAVKLVTKICLIFFGQSGFIVSSVIASFAGIDAIVINLADMAGKAISFKTATFTFILVNATNLLSKSLYAYLQGNRIFASRFLMSVGTVIAVSFVGLFFVF